MNNIYSLGDVARLLNVAPYRIDYAIQVGKVPEPSHRFLAKRCFDTRDVRLIAEHFGVELPVEAKEAS